MPSHLSGIYFGRLHICQEEKWQQDLQDKKGGGPNYFQSAISLLSSYSLTRVQRNHLSNANVARASGYDGIGNKIVKISKEGLHKPLTRLINLSVNLGQYPSCWKMANVLPLFKKDNRQVKSNYRPVSLLPCISKLSEKIVFIEFYKFLEKSFFFSIAISQVFVQVIQP